MRYSIERNPWIPKKTGSLSGADFPQALSLILMGYGVYCVIDWIESFFTGPRLR